MPPIDSFCTDWDGAAKRWTKTQKRAPFRTVSGPTEARLLLGTITQSNKMSLFARVGKRARGLIGGRGRTWAGMFKAPYELNDGDLI